MQWAERSIFYVATLGLLSGLPVCFGEPSTVQTYPSNVSTWLIQHSVRPGDQIEIRLGNGATAKGILRDYAFAQMSVDVKTARPKKAIHSGETKFDYVDISKFSLRIGKGNLGLAILGGALGFQLGILPGMAIGLNDYGSESTEKLGAGVALTGAIVGARWGSKLGARHKITVKVGP